VTFLLMKFIGLILRGARYSDDILEIGDLAIHDEEAFPEDMLAMRSGGFAMAEGAAASVSPPIVRDPSPPPDEGL
jgi:Amt family ammonium transporter